MPIALGAKLDEIQSLLGVGGMGEVYRARDTQLNRMVAIKVLNSQLVRGRPAGMPGHLTTTLPSLSNEGQTWYENTKFACVCNRPADIVWCARVPQRAKI